MVTVKTFAHVKQSLYKAGDSIQIKAEDMNQKIEFKLYSGETKARKLKSLILGLPVNEEMLAGLT